ATIRISLTDNGLEVSQDVDAEVFGAGGGAVQTALEAIEPLGALQLAARSEALIVGFSDAAESAEALDSIGDATFDLDSARVNSSVVAAYAASASLEIETIEAVHLMAVAAAREASIAFGTALNSANGRDTNIQINASLASVFDSVSATALSRVEALLESASSKATNATAAKDLQAAEVEAKEFALQAAADAAAAESEAAEAARLIANQTIKDKVDADNVAEANARELANTAVTKALEASQKLALTIQAAKDVDVDTAKVAAEAAQQAADLAQAAASAAIKAAAGAGSNALAQAARAASAAIEAVTDAGAASASYQIAANSTIAADGWVAGTATADRISAVNAASIAAGNAGKANVAAQLATQALSAATDAVVQPSIDLASAQAVLVARQRAVSEVTAKLAAADDGKDTDSAIETIWKSALAQAQVAEDDAEGSVSAAQAALDAAIAARFLAQSTATSAANAAAAASRVAAEAAARSGFATSFE
ncbi:MAG: hypothetical protein VW907_03785, partial [Opitutae bacterium]